MRIINLCRLTKKKLKLNHKQIIARLGEKRKGLKLMQTLVDSRDPVKNLERGYALVFDAESKLITSAKEIGTDQEVFIHLADGKASATVNEVDQNDQ